MLTHPQKAKMFLPIVLPVFAFLLSINCTDKFIHL